ncbi:hypothetical protein [Methylomonas fluvii]|uniref:Uncharacterized protein n=1 Tax=Methylomonas fluvii TaxID=1854564 RepID=A0ABR9DCG2_9GAMM|nr:hypothetical protein [Methylomonas fluvii]MBD9359934.1 hypothetical protein [Methylomonas fluvii]
MAHPYIQINGNYWVETLKFLQETIVAIALKELSQEEAFNYSATYASLANNNKEKIFNASVLLISSYINFYKVSPREGIYDEFKLIYFLGIAVSIQLKSNGLYDLDKMHLRAVLRLLDLRLHEPHRANRQVLSDRITKAINNGVIQDHFGSYGWYLIYKCLYNAANLRSKMF